MLKSCVRKIMEYVVILFVVSILIFFLIHLFSPTDPVSVIIGGKGGTPEQIQAAREEYHLNEPVWRQYLYWIGGIFHGDWGTSYKYHTPVLQSIADRAPVTLGLVLGASVLSILVAIPLGVASAVKNGKPLDGALSIISLIVAAVPPFLLSMLLILALSKLAPAYPITGGYSGVEGYLIRMFWPCIAQD